MQQSWFSCLTVGSFLSKIMKIPWVADFRDIVEQELMKGLKQNIILKDYPSKKKILEHQQSITVSKHHAQSLEKIWIDILTGLQWLWSGGIPLFSTINWNKFKITYMGRILNEWTRNPNVLLRALIVCFKMGWLMKNFWNKFFGTEKDLVDKLSQKYYCKKFITVLPRLGTIKFRDSSRQQRQYCFNKQGKMGFNYKIIWIYGSRKAIYLYSIRMWWIKTNYWYFKIWFTCENQKIYISLLNYLWKVAQIRQWPHWGKRSTKVFSRKYQTEIFSRILNEVVNRQNIRCVLIDFLKTFRRSLVARVCRVTWYLLYYWCLYDHHCTPPRRRT